MALEFAKELLGDAYTGELEEKLEAKINELYAPKADLDAASARATGCRSSWTPPTRPSVSLKGWTRSR